MKTKIIIAKKTARMATLISISFLTNVDALLGAIYNEKNIQIKNWNYIQSQCQIGNDNLYGYKLTKGSLFKKTVAFLECEGEGDAYIVSTDRKALETIRKDWNIQENIENDVYLSSVI